jgi:hypothetical protein
MWRGQKGSVQTAGNTFFSALGRVWDVVTASAYRQARQKGQPEGVVHLNTVRGEEFYTRDEADTEGGRWSGHRLLGGEGR